MKESGSCEGPYKQGPSHKAWRGSAIFLGGESLNMKKWRWVWSCLANWFKVVACCEFGSIGTSGGWDLEKVPRKSTALPCLTVGQGGNSQKQHQSLVGGVTKGSQSPWHSGSQELKLAMAWSLGPPFTSEISYVNFFQNWFISQFLLSNQRWLTAVSSGLLLPLCGLCITN